MSMGTVVKCGHLSHARMPLQDVYLDEKGRLVENFRVAAFGHIDGDQTPLHYAAKAGSASCVKLLLQGHADANFKDSHLRTAVHIAAMLGAVEALDVLLSTKCIDPVFNRKYDADFSLKDIQGKTALKLATVWECKRLILKRYLERLTGTAIRSNKGGQWCATTSSAGVGVGSLLTLRHDVSAALRGIRLTPPRLPADSDVSVQSLLCTACVSTMPG